MHLADDAALVTSHPTVEEVLAAHASELGRDFVPYRNHVYRVMNLCLAVRGDSRADLEKIGVAAVFHDLGIWTDKTFDYIDPSVAHARAHLGARGKADWIPGVEAMIEDHHKITHADADARSLVESFRRADWIDVTCGWRRFGVPRPALAAVAGTWPTDGFHRLLVKLAVDRFRKHPLSPLPMVKW